MVLITQLHYLYIDIENRGFGGIKRVFLCVGKKNAKRSVRSVIFFHLWYNNLYY